MCAYYVYKERERDKNSKLVTLGPVREKWFLTGNVWANSEWIKRQKLDEQMKLGWQNTSFAADIASSQKFVFSTSKLLKINFYFYNKKDGENIVKIPLPCLEFFQHSRDYCLKKNNQSEITDKKKRFTIFARRLHFFSLQKISCISISIFW